MYRLLFNVVLSRVEPERAHELARRGLRIATANAGGRAIVRRFVGETEPSLKTHALGCTFPSPIGVAAGVDKDATWSDDLAALGFGFVEVGTVTALAQSGNSKPRVARVVGQRALVNRMGFPNPGADVVAERLAFRAQRHVGVRRVVGVNVGKSMAVALDDATADYSASVARVGPVADYLVLNVSSPNTPGLREMQGADELTALVGAVRDELRQVQAEVPLLIKISPDLDDEQIDAIARLALDLELDGIVAVNTTVDRSVLGGGRNEIPFEGGGVSGLPLRQRSVEVLHRLYVITGDRLVLVSVGGIESAEDVFERIAAGATLVQAYTAFVYGGPLWAARVNRALARMVKDAGASTAQELVGAGAGPAQPASAAT